MRTDSLLLDRYLDNSFRQRHSPQIQFSLASCIAPVSYIFSRCPELTCDSTNAHAIHQDYARLMMYATNVCYKSNHLGIIIIRDETLSKEQEDKPEKSATILTYFIENASIQDMLERPDSVMPGRVGSPKSSREVSFFYDDLHKNKVLHSLPSIEKHITTVVHNKYDKHFCIPALL